jgi:hypothetical protein
LAFAVDDDFIAVQFDDGLGGEFSATVVSIFIGAETGRFGPSSDPAVAQGFVQDRDRFNARGCVTQLTFKFHQGHVALRLVDHSTRPDADVLIFRSVAHTEFRAAVELTMGSSQHPTRRDEGA